MYTRFALGLLKSLPLPMPRKYAGQAACPRILGLTASFVNGALKNVEQKRKDLEASYPKGPCSFIVSTINTMGPRYVLYR